jgi:hypothetical protein
MIPNIGKTTIITFTSYVITINFNYKFCNNLVLRSQRVKGFRVLLAC